MAWGIAGAIACVSYSSWSSPAFDGKAEARKMIARAVVCRVLWVLLRGISCVDGRGGVGQLFGRRLSPGPAIAGWPRALPSSAASGAAASAPCARGAALCVRVCSGDGHVRDFCLPLQQRAGGSVAAAHFSLCQFSASGAASLGASATLESERSHARIPVDVAQAERIKKARSQSS